MPKAILLVPSEEAIDRSLDARAYVTRLSKRLDVARGYYGSSGELPAIGDDVASVGVLSGLSALELESGYVEMELDSIFRPQEMLGTLRKSLGREFPIVAIVDDAYSDYIMSSFIKAGATAVVGTSGDLFGVVLSRMKSWDQVLPYINAFPRL
jgi:hypothetical protein